MGTYSWRLPLPRIATSAAQAPAKESSVLAGTSVSKATDIAATSVCAPLSYLSQALQLIQQAEAALAIREEQSTLPGGMAAVVKGVRHLVNLEKAQTLLSMGEFGREGE